MNTYNILSLKFSELFKFFFKVIPAFYLAMIIWWAVIILFLMTVLAIAEMFALSDAGKAVTVHLLQL